MVDVTMEGRVSEHDVWTRSGLVQSHLESQTIERIEEQAAATVADPSSLGLWALATGTWIFGVVTAGWLAPSAVIASSPVMFVFAGVVQFIAGLFAFRRANALLATALCSFGGLYGTAGIAFLLFGGAPAGGLGEMVGGDFLASFGLIAAALTFAASRVSFGLMTTFGLLAVGYFFTAFALWTGTPPGAGGTVLASIGAAALCVAAACAFYVGTAMVVNASWRRPALPMGLT